MKTYAVKLDVTDVSGTRTFTVEAESPELALDLVMDGEGDLIDEDLYVGLERDGATVFETT